MSVNDIVLLFTGGAVGVAMDRLWDPLRAKYTQVRVAIARVHRKRVDNNKQATRELGEFYQKKITVLTPYRATESGREFVLPILSGQDWISVSQLDATSEALIKFDPSAKSRFETLRTRSTKRLALRGARIYEGQICYVSEYNPTGRPTWTVGVCSYAAYASFLLELEAKGLSKSYVTRSRRRLFSDPLATISEGVRPVAVGATVALVDGHSRPYSVLLQRRSSEVIVDAGKLSFVPVFGLEPNATSARRSHLGLLQYNVVREFGEELFDLPELIELSRSGRINPDWIRTIEPISNLENSWQSGDVDFYTLGTGIDLLNPSLHIVIAGVSRNPEGWLSLLAEASGNWEIAGARVGSPSLLSVELESAELAKYVNENQLSSTSVFAYDLLRKWAQAGTQLVLQP